MRGSGGEALRNFRKFLYNTMKTIEMLEIFYFPSFFFIFPFANTSEKFQWEGGSSLSSRLNFLNNLEKFLRMI